METNPAREKAVETEIIEKGRRIIVTFRGIQTYQNGAYNLGNREVMTAANALSYSKRAGISVLILDFTKVSKIDRLCANLIGRARLLLTGGNILMIVPGKTRPVAQSVKETPRVVTRKTREEAIIATSPLNIARHARAKVRSFSRQMRNAAFEESRERGERVGKVVREIRAEVDAEKSKSSKTRKKASIRSKRS